MSFMNLSTSLKVEQVLRSEFRKRYSDFFAVKPNSIFNVHKPIGLKYLTRLRVGFSHLKSQV